MEDQRKEEAWYYAHRDEIREMEKRNQCCCCPGYTPPPAPSFPMQQSVSGAFLIGFIAGIRAGMESQDKPLDKSSLYEWCYLNKWCSRTGEKCEGDDYHDDIFPCKECPHKKEDSK